MFGKSKLGNICYYVSNIDKTEAFYRDVMGLELQRMEGDADTAGDWLLANTANGVDLIFFAMESRPGNSPIIVFEIADGGIDDIVSTLADNGVTIVTPVSHAPGGWSSEFTDPDGHVISMYQSAEAPRSLKKVA
ncbi:MULTISPECIES: VOC family protein [Aminobacter]|jgi:predicted enzyme related to lactoylglutathione lyase|uniref:Enzyme related to lactoylglutathione lyase n=2 Tax=Aminobacter TaxID=31988 RepID=A0AAC8YKT0_AMIAI|nr:MULTISPECIES: VOC family protein [Aminobacter]AMS40250.1 Glyoxalase/bleomycin resistance protein/dioxygenase [Aminobacter aminovorans]MBA8907094.1 putative enzyme related to lactoylglutathione lyase [Aminobacter ciceronei]MBA9020648.1 putative enzyme related to lactoylglutathione lyase [Aminobacter ciceronei]MBB3710283.1 putative enzyme related to lactoylglutathione lyase [Aminobacter aminovorans]WMC96560.1 VOC family protein [Aminobacter aminovorans]